ncbi:MAG: Cobalt-zinc-cadmium resistance protein CzcA [Chlamydiae bacterium]|nr:Cobalt-zinc-cadmium resistance protein CzcA [Chlamydiota bacterium]
MIRSIIQSSIKFRYLVIAVGLAIILFGANRLREMPVDVFPEFAPPLVEIQTEALGLSAEEVESLITLNLEEFISGTSWIKTIRSESVPGMSSILMIFEPGTDIMRARQLVQERLSLAYTMPNVSKPPIMLQPLSTTNRAMMIGLSSKELTPIQMSVLARWTIKPRLMGVRGVANVVIWGQRKRQLQVQIDPERLKANGVTQEQIIRTTGDALWVSPLSFLKASIPGTGGWIDTPNQRLGIRHVSPISSPEDLAQLPVHGATMRLGEVADVVEGHPPLIGDAFLNDGPGLILVVEKLPWANTLEVTREVEKALNALIAGLPGLEVDSTIFQSANYITTAIDNLTMALIISAVLVVLVLFAFLYEWRVALISIVAIPLSLMTATLVLYFQGTTINTMILAGFGIAIGVIVDDAIIDIENIVRRLRQHRKEGSQKGTASIILEASLEVRRAIIYATLIIVMAIVPVFFMGGVSGAFFQPLALAYSLALLASMMVALTVTPALGYVLLHKSPIKKRESHILLWLKNAYDAVLKRTIHAPKTAFLTAGVLLIIGIVLWPFLGQSLLPTFKERDILIEMDALAGTSHKEMSRIMDRARKDLKSIPGVSNVGAHIGRAITGDQIVNINSGQIWVSIDPKAPYEETVAAIKQTIADFPGLDRDVHTYLKEKVRDVIAGASEAVVVRLYGPNQEILRSKAEEIREAIANIDGIVNLQVESQEEEPHIEIKVDIAKAEPYGIKPGDVRRAASTIFAGIEVGSLFEEQKIFDVVVWSTPEARHSINNIRELLIDTPKGGHVRLKEIAEVNIVPAPTVIKHEAISPRVDIVADVNGRDLDTVSREVEQVLKKIEFPVEYHPELLGEYTERLTAQKQLLSIAIAAAIGIYLLLQASFGSWRLASIAFLALPTALVGGVIAAFFGGGIISIGSLVGFLAILGIAARNGIMLINHYQYLQHYERETFGPELILRGAKERLAPILMTVTTTGLALLPLVFFGEIAGLEIEYPMAVVILGGLVTSTLLNMFIVPPLYLIFGSNSKPKTLEDLE